MNIITNWILVGLFSAFIVLFVRIKTLGDVNTGRYIRNVFRQASFYEFCIIFCLLGYISIVFGLIISAFLILDEEE